MFLAYNALKSPLCKKVLTSKEEDENAERDVNVDVALALDQRDDPTVEESAPPKATILDGVKVSIRKRCKRLPQMRFQCSRTASLGLGHS